LGEPSTIAATRFTFGFHMRLLRLCEWLTLIPKDTPLLQYEHFAISFSSMFLCGDDADNGVNNNRIIKELQENF